MKVAAGHVLHHDAVVPLAVEVFFEADYVRAALAAGLHLNLLLDSLPGFLTFFDVRYNF